MEHKTICFLDESYQSSLAPGGFLFCPLLYISLLASELSRTRSMVPHVMRFIVKNCGATRDPGTLSAEEMRTDRTDQREVVTCSELCRSNKWPTPQRGPSAPPALCSLRSVGHSTISHRMTSACQACLSPSTIQTWSLPS